MNRSPAPEVLRLPRRRRPLLGWGLLGVVGLLSVAAGGYALLSLLGPDNHDAPPLHTVRYAVLERTIKTRGELQPVDASEITCRVRGLRHNATHVTSIKWIIEDGTPVKRGDVLAILDDSEFQDGLALREGPLELSRAVWIAAREEHQILVAQNEANLLKAESDLVLAELDRNKFLYGDSVRMRKDYEGRLALAQSEWTMWGDREQWAGRMLRRRYIGQGQYQMEEARTHAARYALGRLVEEQRVYQEHTSPRTRVDLESRLTQARAARLKVLQQGRAREAQSEAACLSAERNWLRRDRRYREIQQEIRKCILRAPHDGLVIHARPTSSRSGSSSSGLVAQGEPVREGQVLMRLPNLSQMVVHALVHEALVARLQGDRWEPTHSTDTLLACLATTTQGTLSRLAAVSAFDEVRHEFHEWDQRLVADGMPALIEIAGHTDRPLRGHVKQVASLPTRVDGMSSEINLYRTIISIDDPVNYLKPDLSAAVTIFENSGQHEVLTVPIDAVLYDPGEGDDCRVLVMTPHGPIEREVVVGSSNERFVEVREGLEELEQVVVDARRWRRDHRSVADDTP